VSAAEPVSVAELESRPPPLSAFPASLVPLLLLDDELHARNVATEEPMTTREKAKARLRMPATKHNPGRKM
jgi:hypothetical protein